MTTQEKINELIDLGMNNFSTEEIDFLSNMIDQESFSSKQEIWIENLYDKHFGKDDGKL